MAFLSLGTRISVVCWLPFPVKNERTEYSK